jgi:hypothetical protein
MRGSTARRCPGPCGTERTRARIARAARSDRRSDVFARCSRRPLQLVGADPGARPANPWGKDCPETSPVLGPNDLLPMSRSVGDSAGRGGPRDPHVRHPPTGYASRLASRM